AQIEFGPHAAPALQLVGISDGAPHLVDWMPESAFVAERHAIAVSFDGAISHRKPPRPSGVRARRAAPSRTCGTAPATARFPRAAPPAAGTSATDGRRAPR